MTASWAGVCFDTPRARSFNKRFENRFGGAVGARRLGLRAYARLAEALGALLVLPALGEDLPHRVDDEDVGHDADPDERDRQSEGLPKGGDRVPKTKDVRHRQHASTAYPPGRSMARVGLEPTTDG